MAYSLYEGQLLENRITGDRSKVTGIYGKKITTEYVTTFTDSDGNVMGSLPDDRAYRVRPIHRVWKYLAPVD